MMTQISRLRKIELKQLSDTMELDVSSKLTKKELLHHIRQTENFDRHLRCYNQQDPCTLCPLHSIPAEDYIEWEQSDKRFGANVNSIRQLFDVGLYTLPFALDLKEGETTDMRTVATLVDATNRTINERPQQRQEEISMMLSGNISSSQFMFEIEKLCGDNFGYINGSISKNILSNPEMFDIHLRMINAMYNVLDQLEVECPFVYHVFIDFCYYPLMLSISPNKQALLALILNCLRVFISVVGERGHNVVFVIFNDI